MLLFSFSKSCPLIERSFNNYAHMTVFSQELSKMNEELLHLSVTMQQEKDTLMG